MKVTRWIVVILFAAAMAWMESATVLYLRTLVNRVDPYQARPLPISSFNLGTTEMIREAATVVMLVAVGWLAGRATRQRFGYFLIAFGMWDILYYVFLMLISGWPRSLWEWDVLFLLPLPWWGPVIAPTAIAVLLVVSGTLIVGIGRSSELEPWPGLRAWGIACTGAVLALYVFMADTIAASAAGLEGVRNALPTGFNWPLFILALVLMLAPALDMLGQMRRREILATSQTTHPIQL